LPYAPINAFLLEFIKTVNLVGRSLLRGFETIRGLGLSFLGQVYHGHVVARVGRG
jgi:hypothetical protein